MKKLKLGLSSIGELLSKEQMKMVTGGDGYTATCSYLIQNEYYPYNIIEVTIETQVPSREDSCFQYCAWATPLGGQYQSCTLS